MNNTNLNHLKYDLYCYDVLCIFEILGLISHFSLQNLKSIASMYLLLHSLAEFSNILFFL